MTAPLAAERRGVTWLDLLAVAVVTFAVFGPVLRTPFAPLDDYLMLQSNSDITRPTWTAFKSFWTQSSFRIYMPLALSIWQTVARLTQSSPMPGGDLLLNPLAFKVVSVTTHALAAAAAAWALSTLTRTRWPAVLGALVFALHPLQVESVAWTTGLKDELCGLFAVLCVGFYARHAFGNAPLPWKDPWWWASVLAALLAMASKPTAMVLPAILLYVDWTVRQTDLAARFRSAGPFLLPAITCALIIGTVQGNTTSANLPLPLRPLVAADSYAFYLGKVVWPANLSVDYGRRPLLIRASGELWWTWVVPAVALVGVLLLRSRWAFLAAVLFVVPVLPVSGLASFDMQQYTTVTDHYVYQSLFGVGLLVAVLVIRFPKAVGMVAVLWIVALSVTTRHTATRWQDFETFYRDNLKAHPESFLARDLLSNFAAARGDLYSSRRLVEESLKISPTNGGALDNLSIIYMLMGKYRESADAATKAIPHLPLQRLSVARRLTLLGQRLHDLDVTEAGLRYWRTIEPDNPFVTRMLRVVQAAKVERAATRPKTGTS